MTCVAMAPMAGPPRVSRSVFLLITAATALRTFASLNGLTLVLSAIMRRLPADWMTVWLLRLVSSCLRIGVGGAAKSPLATLVPVMILRLATSMSLPPRNVILFRYAGR